MDRASVASAIADGNDFILPVYRRHKFDGLLIGTLSIRWRGQFTAVLSANHTLRFCIFRCLGSHFSRKTSGIRTGTKGHRTLADVGGSGRGIQSSAIVSGPNAAPKMHHPT